MLGLVSDLRRRKLAKLFDVLDTDDDEWVGVEDYEALGQRLANVAGNKSETQLAEMRETFRLVWDEFQGNADTNDDGQVSKDEFVSSILSPMVTDPLRFTRYVGLTCNLLFGIADANNNRSLSKAEHIAIGTKAFGLSTAEATKSFDKLDFWGKGGLAMDAYIIGYTEFLTSDLPTSNGNWLFGDF
jgi:hypothetical protein